MNKPLPLNAIAMAIVFASGFAANANANCLMNKLPRFAKGSPGARIMAAGAPKRPDPATSEDAPAASDPTIVGLWNVQFVAGGQVVDAGFDAWHADGTETLNDTTPPSAGAVCLGVWTKQGNFNYKLKHPSWLFDDTGVNLIGIAMIRETITLDKGGNSYTGDLSVDIYDLGGNLLQHLDAKIRALRITTDDKPNDIGLPGFPAWPQM